MENITTVIKFLRDNPEFGRAFHEHFEDRRDDLIGVKWTRSDPELSRKCNIGAEMIQAEILDMFDLKSLSRLPKDH
jgi:hypothetical protein